MAGYTIAFFRRRGDYSIAFSADLGIPSIVDELIGSADSKT